MEAKDLEFFREYLTQMIDDIQVCCTQNDWSRCKRQDEYKDHGV